MQTELRMTPEQDREWNEAVRVMAGAELNLGSDLPRFLRDTLKHTAVAHSTLVRLGDAENAAVLLRTHEALQDRAERLEIAVMLEREAARAERRAGRVGPEGVPRGYLRTRRLEVAVELRAAARRIREG